MMAARRDGYMAAAGVAVSGKSLDTTKAPTLAGRGGWFLLPFVALVPLLIGAPHDAASVYYAATWPPDYSASRLDTLTYQYSPAFALAIQPFRALPYVLFVYALNLGTVFSLAYLVGPVLAA